MMTSLGLSFRSEAEVADPGEAGIGGEMRKTAARGVQSDGSPNPGGFFWRLTSKPDF
jgi:hypothetical protein